MDYHITRYDHGHRVSGIAMWEGQPFSAVQTHARELVETGAASRVEVRNQMQELVYHWPRVVKPAP